MHAETLRSTSNASHYTTNAADSDDMCRGIKYVFNPAFFESASGHCSSSSSAKSSDESNSNNSSNNVMSNDGIMRCFRDVVQVRVSFTAYNSYLKY